MIGAREKVHLLAAAGALPEQAGAAGDGLWVADDLVLQAALLGAAHDADEAAGHRRCRGCGQAPAPRLLQWELTFVSSHNQTLHEQHSSTALNEGLQDPKLCKEFRK